MLHCVATDKDDPTDEPRWGRVGRQKVTDTGPLTKKRMETVDEEITAKAIEWMDKQAKANQPFFLWYNSTAMHFRTHLAEKNRGKSGQDDYSDRMVVHDEQVGQLLKKLDELGIADNTFVMYSTDNGPENDTWPDGANTPFRGQKDSGWEGGWRVPCFLRWPDKIKAGTTLNGICSHIDMMPTILAIAGDDKVTEKCLNGYKVGNMTYKVHLDGHNLVPYLTGQTKESPRQSLMYFSDDGEVIAVRVGDYKFHLALATRQHDETVGRTVREGAAPVHHESPSRPVRAGRVQLEHVSGLDGQSRAPDVPDAGGGGVGDRQLHQIPAAPEAGVVQP